MRATGGRTARPKPGRARLPASPPAAFRKSTYVANTDVIFVHSPTRMRCAPGSRQKALGVLLVVPPRVMRRCHAPKLYAECPVFVHNRSAGRRCRICLAAHMQETLPLVPTGVRRGPILRELLPTVRGHLWKRFVHRAQKLVNRHRLSGCWCRPNATPPAVPETEYAPADN
jgi:hypothetical protein